MRKNLPMNAMLIILLQTASIPGIWQKVDALQPGTAIRIVLKSGQSINGSFKGSSPDALVVTGESGSDVTAAKGDVRQVVRPGVPDRLRNGALIGTAAGFGSGFLTIYALERGYTASGYRFDPEDAVLCTYGGMIGAGIGAIIGSLVDRGIKGNEILFQAVK